MKQLLPIILVSLLVSCSTEQPPSVVTATPAPTPIYENNVDTALENFLEQHYKDWKYVGISDEFNSFADGDPATLHLTKSDEEIVIPVSAKVFRKVDGHRYWVVSVTPAPLPTCQEK